MAVGVHKARQQGASFKVNQFRSSVLGLEHFSLGAHGEDFAIPDRHGLGSGLGVGDGENGAIVIDGIRGFSG